MFHCCDTEQKADFKDNMHNVEIGSLLIFLKAILPEMEQKMFNKEHTAGTGSSFVTELQANKTCKSLWVTVPITPRHGQ